MISTTAVERRRLAALLTGLVMAIAVVSGTAPAHAQTGTLEWTVTPADADGPDDRISLRHDVEPRDVVEDHIAVTNLGDAAAQFTVAAGDGVIGSSGAFDLAPGEPVAAGGWLGIEGLGDGGTLELDAGVTTVLPVTISVPRDVTPGDHPAGIVVSVSQTVGGVSVTNRVGVRVHLRVAGDVEPALAVDVLSTSYTPSPIPFAPGTLEIEYVVENTGNVRLRAAPQVAVAGPLGVLEAQQAVTGIEELLPGTSSAGRAELQVPPLFALFGELGVSPVAVGQDQIPAGQAAVSSFSGPAISWTGVAVLVLLLLAAVLLVRRRRRRARSAARTP